MNLNATSVANYLSKVPKERQTYFNKLRLTILNNIPKGFSEELSYGMIGYVVPHSLYPQGYHCNPKLPLPFVSIASQKNFIALYHMGVYAQPSLLEWFTKAYPLHSKNKIDMGKSCIRFKQLDDIPFELIGELIQKINFEEWIEIYEQNIKR